MLGKLPTHVFAKNHRKYSYKIEFIWIQLISFLTLPVNRSRHWETESYLAVRGLTHIKILWQHVDSGESAKAGSGQGGVDRTQRGAWDQGLVLLLGSQGILVAVCVPAQGAGCRSGVRVAHQLSNWSVTPLFLLVPGRGKQEHFRPGPHLQYLSEAFL